MDAETLDGIDDRLRLAQAVAERLLDEDVPAGRHGRLDEGSMRCRRRADVDRIDTGVAGKEFLERREGRDREPLGEGRPRPRSGLDDRRELRVTRGEEARNVLGLCDVAAANDRDPDPSASRPPTFAPARCAHGSRRARACTRSASSITLKQWAWDIAVSVRSRTSRTSAT